MPSVGEVGGICWWFGQWLTQEKRQGSATPENQSWNEKWIANKTCCQNPVPFFSPPRSKDPVSLIIFFEVFSHGFFAFSSGRTSLQMTRDPSVQLPRPDQCIERSRSKTYPKRTQQTGKSFSAGPVETCLFKFLVHFLFKRWFRTAAASSRISQSGFSLLP